MQTSAHSLIRNTAPGTPVCPAGDQCRQIVDLPALINDFCTWYSQCLTTKNLRLITSTSPNIPKYVMGNLLLMHRMLREPARNSLSYLGKGAVHLNIEAQQYSKRRYSLLVNLVLTGGAISPARSKELFQSGSSLSARDGFRLRSKNLYYSKMIAEMLGGDVRIDESNELGLRYLMEVKLFVPHSEWRENI